MSPIEFRFLIPWDVVLFRGNKLFGDPGSYGEALMPPWPSVVAGALRSRILVDDGVDLARFAEGREQHPSLGTPQQPGAFRVVTFQTGRRFADGRTELLYQIPADLFISGNEKQLHARRVRPTKPKKPGVASSYPLPLLPVVQERERGKPKGGYWLTEDGWNKYLAGEVPGEEHLLPQEFLWEAELRIGVGIEEGTRRAAQGRLFSVEALSFVRQGCLLQSRRRAAALKRADYDVGFVVGIRGASPPRDGSVRLGGDGRGAVLSVAELRLPEPDYERMARDGTCRLILTTPGIFPGGWLPTGTVENPSGGFRFQLHGVRGRLMAAAVARAVTISGWDLARWAPKPAQRAAPTGSVYWLELESGVTSTDLRKLAESGLWDQPCHDPQRRAEGFNCAALAVA